MWAWSRRRCSLVPDRRCSVTHPDPARVNRHQPWPALGGHTLARVRPRIPVWLAGAATLVSLLIAGCGGSTQRNPSPSPARRPSSALVGVMFDGPVLARGVNLDQQVGLAVRSGAQSLRVS